MLSCPTLMEGAAGRRALAERVLEFARGLVVAIIGGVRATAIIPVKRFGQAKQRLLDRLDRPQRAAIVKAMLADVLAATSAADSIERVIVVTGEGRAERLALRHAQRSTTPLEVLQEPDRPRPLRGGDAGDRAGAGARRRVLGAAARRLPAARRGGARRRPRADGRAAAWR